MPLLDKYRLHSKKACGNASHTFFVLFSFLIFIALSHFSSCSTPEKPLSVSFDFDKTGQQLAYFYNIEATQYSLAASYSILPVPDSSFWEDRTNFIKETITHLDQFIQVETEHSKAKKWKYLFEKIDSTAAGNSLEFYHTFKRFDKILQKKKLKPVQKLDVLSQKLSILPTFIRNAILKVNQSSSSEIKDFENDLEQLYFLINNDLPKKLKLNSQEKEVQKEIYSKIKTATLAVKNMLSYCRSKRNEVREN